MLLTSLWKILTAGALTVAMVTGKDLECYHCSSSLEASCIHSPTKTISCPTSKGKGCAVHFLSDGVIERGCSKIGLSPDGCQVSTIFGTECVCHSDRCNEGIPAHRRGPEEAADSTLNCYKCDSNQMAICSHDLLGDVPLATCPAKNGCYFMKRINEEEQILYHRLCYENGPATYYPAGCYTVFNDQTSTSSEVCVCYMDECNRNRLTALQSLTTEKAKVVNSSQRLTHSIQYSIAVILTTFLYFLL